MHKETSERLISPKMIIFFAVAVVIGYFLVTGVINSRLSDIEISTRGYIAEQGKALSVIAETTARNGADEVTESIIRECDPSNRNRFNILLGKIERLNWSELNSLDQLFDQCGGVFLDRKSLMVSRFEREVEVYEQLVAHLEIITREVDQTEFQVSEWRQLLDHEVEIKNGFAELYEYQRLIIEALLEGKTSTSPDVESILVNVVETREEMALATTQAAELRSALTGL